MRTINPRLLFLALVVAAAATFAPPAQAQQRTERFDGMTGRSEVRVDGTSTLHDWTAKSPTIAGNITFKFDLPDDASEQAVRAAIVARPAADADVAIEVRGLKSGKKDMDDKMYEALKAKQHPQIRYRLTQFVLAKDTKADQEAFDVQTKGELTVAGVTREIAMPMRLTVTDSKHLKISGRIAMRMTDFKVKPPQAMLGMIKSGDKIDVSFTWNVERVKEPAKVPAKSPRAKAK